MTHITPNTVQSNFRFRNDDGSQTAATWIANATTHIGLGTGNRTFRLRVEVRETAGAATTVTGVLRYSLNFGTYTNVSTSSSVVRFVTSAFVADNTATTEQLAGPGTFTAGVIDSDGAYSIALNLQDTEIEFVLQLQGVDVAVGDTIDFRISGLNAYNVTPQIQIVQQTITAPVIESHSSAYSLFKGNPVIAGSRRGRNATNSTGHSITLPPSIAAGDLLFIFFANDSDATASVDGGAWTTYYSDALGTAIRHTAFYKTADGTETTANITTSAAEMSAYIALRITGDGGAGYAFTRNNNSGNNNVPNATSPSLPWSNRHNLWLGVNAWDGNQSLTQYPADLHEDRMTDRAAATDGCGINLAATSTERATTSIPEPIATLSANTPWQSQTLAISILPTTLTVPVITAPSSVIEPAVLAGVSVPIIDSPATVISPTVSASVTLTTIETELANPHFRDGFYAGVFGDIPNGWIEDFTINPPASTVSTAVIDNDIVRMTAEFVTDVAEVGIENENAIHNVPVGTPFLGRIRYRMIAAPSFWWLRWQTGGSSSRLDLDSYTLNVATVGGDWIDLDFSYNSGNQTSALPLLSLSIDTSAGVATIEVDYIKVYKLVPSQKIVPVIGTSSLEVASIDAPPPLVTTITAPVITATSTAITPTVSASVTLTTRENRLNNGHFRGAINTDSYGDLPDGWDRYQLSITEPTNPESTILDNDILRLGFHRDTSNAILGVQQSPYSGHPSGTTFLAKIRYRIIEAPTAWDIRLYRGTSGAWHIIDDNTLNYAAVGGDWIDLDFSYENNTSSGQAILGIRTTSSSSRFTVEFDYLKIYPLVPAEKHIPVISTSFVDSSSLLTSSITRTAPVITASSTVFAPSITVSSYTRITKQSLDILLTNPNVTLEPPVITVTSTVLEPTLNTVVSLAAPVITATATVIEPTVNTAVIIGAPLVAAGTTVLSPSIASVSYTRITKQSIDALFVFSESILTVPVITATSTVLEPIVASVVTLAAPIITATTTVLEPTILADTALDGGTINPSGTIIPPGVVSEVTIAAPIITATATVIEPTIFTGETTIVAPVITAASSVLPPDVLTGAVIVEPPVIISSGTVEPPDVNAGAIIVGAPVIEATAVVIEPAVLTGTTLDGGIISPSGTVTPPTIVSDVTIAAPVITAVATAIEPTVLAGSTTISAPVITAASSVLPPSILIDAAIIEPPVIVASGEVYPPDLVAGAAVIGVPVITATTTVTPPLLDGSSLIVVPTITASTSVLSPSIVTSSYTRVTKQSVDVFFVFAEQILVPEVIIGTGTVLPPTIVTTAIITVPIVDATGDVLPPTVLTDVILDVPVINASGDVDPPNAYGPGVIGAPIIIASTDVLPPAIVSSVTITAPIIEATTTVLPPDLIADVILDVPVIDTSGTIEPPAADSPAVISMPIIDATATAIDVDVVTNVVLTAPIIDAAAEALDVIVILGAVLIQVPVIDASGEVLDPSILQGEIIVVGIIDAVAEVLPPLVSPSGTTIDVPIIDGGTVILPPDVTAPSPSVIEVPIIDASGDVHPPLLSGTTFTRITKQSIDVLFLSSPLVDVDDGEADADVIPPIVKRQPLSTICDPNCVCDDRTVPYFPVWRPIICPPANTIPSS